MKYVALTGQAYSGKSTLAEHLDGRGYLRVHFSRLLKQNAADALSHIWKPITADQIERDKPRYRRFLQELGDLTDFNNDPAWIYDSLAEWYSLGRPPAVFDCVRTESQAQTLVRMGFKIVRLMVTRGAQYKRAEQAGVSGEELYQQLNHHTEKSVTWVDLVLDGSASLYYNADRIIACS